MKTSVYTTVNIQNQKDNRSLIESTRFLNEITNQARENLIQEIKIENNTVSVQGISFYAGNPLYFNSKEIVILFKLNNKDYKIQRTIKVPYDKIELAQLLYKTISEAITIEIMKSSDLEL